MVFADNVNGSFSCLPGFIEMPGIHRLHETVPEPGPMPSVQAAPT
jgi:hypothetical protein